MSVKPSRTREYNGRSLRNIRVSVLDLDNICSFQQADEEEAEETAAKSLAPKGTSLRSLPNAAGSNSVDVTSRLLSK